MHITYSFELAELNKIANLLAIPARAYEAEIEIDAEIYGKYLPATWDFPAEYPELEVEKVSNLVVSFYEESQNLTWGMKLGSELISSEELNKLLEPHWTDIENYLWEVYHDNQEWR